ncbi:MAG: hypothetical protein Q9164_004340 [Protoblastenia rupestris]
MSDKLDLDPYITEVVERTAPTRYKRGRSEPPTREARKVYRSIKEHRELFKEIDQSFRTVGRSEKKGETQKRHKATASSTMVFRNSQCPDCETATSSSRPIAAVQCRPWEHSAFPPDVQTTTNAPSTTAGLTHFGNNVQHSGYDTLGSGLLADRNSDLAANLEPEDCRLTEKQQNTELQFKNWSDGEKPLHDKGTLWDEKEFLLNKMFVRCVAEITSFSDQDFRTFMKRPRAEQCQILDEYIQTAILHVDCIKFNPFAKVSDEETAECLSKGDELLEDDEEDDIILAPFRKYAAPYPWFGFLQSMLLPHGTFRASKTPRTVNGKRYHFSERDLDAFLALAESDQRKWFVYFDQKLEAAGLSNKPKGSVKIRPDGRVNYVPGDPSPWIEPRKRPGYLRQTLETWNCQWNSDRRRDKTENELSGHSSVGLISLSSENWISAHNAHDGSFKRVNEMESVPAKTSHC